MQRPTITPEDHDAGFIEVDLEYKRGTTPANHPDKLRITPVPSTRAQQFYLEAFSKSDPMLFLTKSVQPDFRGEDFLNKLTPECLGILNDVAFEMIYGPAKKKELEAIAMKALSLMTSLPSVAAGSSSPQESPAPK